MTVDQMYDPAPPIPAGFVIGTAEGPTAMQAAQILSEANAENTGDVPVIEEAPPGDALLPGGVIVGGVLRRDAVVRELTGRDEEFIARAMNSTNPGRMIEVLLERGVESIGGRAAGKAALDSLLIGDREVLALEIRKVTYGRTADLDMVCQQCGTQSHVQVDLDEDITVKQIDLDRSVPFHKIDLPSGATCKVRLANGTDQAASFAMQQDNPGVTLTDLNTMLLSRVVMEVDDYPLSPKDAKDAVSDMLAKDRRAIVKFLNDNQPEVEYAKVKHACAVCGLEQPLGLTPADLFPAY